MTRLQVSSSMLPLVVVILVAVRFINVEGKPFPAVDFKNCRSDVSGCCNIPLPTVKRNFTFPTFPMRTRKAAQLVDEAYVAKLQKAYELMKALPLTDGRAFDNQRKLHCVYCDSSFFFPGLPYNLEIHNAWFFLPWHRLYLYFHERILAKLLDDDTFTLPFWNWDDQSQVPPLGNISPYIYANKTFGPDNTTSYLYDGTRNSCNAPPTVVDFDPEPPLFCTNKSATDQSFVNDCLVYTQIVAGATTPTLFFGQPYRYGDTGATGGGTLEARPHGELHPWNSVTYGMFNEAASDPIFYALHANVDRMWEVWKNLPGGFRKDLTDPDWLNTRFTFYDEDGNIVEASVAQAVDLEKLRYRYQKVRKPSWTKAKYLPFCNKQSSKSDDKAMIKTTPYLNETGATLFLEPLTFKVKRPSKVARLAATGEEVLVIEGVNYNWTQNAIVDVYFYYPTVNTTKLFTCPEWIGMWQFSFPHPGMWPVTPLTTLRISIGTKLRDMKRDGLSDIVVTLLQRQAPGQLIQFKSANITFFDS